MLNQTTIIGNLGEHPEQREVKGKGGKKTQVAEFSVAVNRKGASPQWFTVNAWGALAGVAAQYLAKGKRVLVQGRVRTSAYLGGDGKAHARLIIDAERIVFLSPKGDAAESGEPGTAEDAEALEALADEPDAF